MLRNHLVDPESSPSKPYAGGGRFAAPAATSEWYNGASQGSPESQNMGNQPSFPMGNPSFNNMGGQYQPSEGQYRTNDLPASQPLPACSALLHSFEKHLEKHRQTCPKM